MIREGEMKRKQHWKMYNKQKTRKTWLLLERREASEEGLGETKLGNTQVHKLPDACGIQKHNVHDTKVMEVKNELHLGRFGAFDPNHKISIRIFLFTWLCSSIFELAFLYCSVSLS